MIELQDELNEPYKRPFRDCLADGSDLGMAWMGTDHTQPHAGAH